MIKTLETLLDGFSKNELSAIEGIDFQSPVSNVTSNSSEVTQGSVFVAIRGTQIDGHLFLQEAAKKGAVLLVGEQLPPTTLNIPYLQVADSRLAIAQIAANYYDNPTDQLLMLGVTGTSGKTTITYLLESILKAAGHQVGILGTVNFRYGSKILPSSHTTPGPVELQSILSQMKAEGCTAVVMEVSSHALKQKRARYVAFDGVIFTNLSPEHLDFHPDMEDYYQSKALLFTEMLDFAKTRKKHPVAAINLEDHYGKRLIQELGQTSLGVWEFQVGKDLQVTLNGISGQIDGISIQSQLTGQFNGSNIAAAVKLAQGLNLSKEHIEEGIRNLKGVPGRLERVSNQSGIHVWVDYAHKPDALEKVIQTLCAVKGNHRLITVFGCGGDRDRKKRPLMGKIAVEGSDQVIVTSDNPRTEDPLAIIQEILVEIQTSKKVKVEPDRRKAIYQAIQSAKSGDLVLIAGKGHEDYQILGKSKVHFDDREVASEAFCSLEGANS